MLTYLFAELLRCERRVGMHVESIGGRRVGLAGHEPAGAVVGVAIAFAVDGHDVDEHGVAAAFPRVHVGHRHLDHREHPSEIASAVAASRPRRGDRSNADGLVLK